MLSGVQVHVLLQVDPLGEGIAAHITNMFFYPLVERVNMSFKAAFVVVHLIAPFLWTFEEVTYILHFLMLTLFCLL